MDLIDLAQSPENDKEGLAHAVLDIFRSRILGKDLALELVPQDVRQLFSHLHRQKGGTTLNNFIKICQNKIFLSRFGQRPSNQHSLTALTKVIVLYCTV